VKGTTKSSAFHGVAEGFNELDERSVLEDFGAEKHSRAACRAVAKKSKAVMRELGTANQNPGNGAVDYRRLTRKRAVKNREKPGKSPVF
jgi:hypothetical protein